MFLANRDDFFIIRSCGKFFHQSLIDPDQHFNHDQDRAEIFSSKVRKKIFNQSLPKKIQAWSG
jgi:hypothetical protein